MQDDNLLQEMIERADFDQDGLVSEEEFYNLLTKKAYWSFDDYEFNIFKQFIFKNIQIHFSRDVN